MNNLEHIIKDNLVEKLSSTIIQKEESATRKDFIQSIYLILLEKTDVVNNIDNYTNLRNYIITIIRQQYFSTTSAFYYTYKKYENKKINKEFDVTEDGEVIFQKKENILC